MDFPDPPVSDPDESDTDHDGEQDDGEQDGSVEQDGDVEPDGGVAHDDGRADELDLIAIVGCSIEHFRAVRRRRIVVRWPLLFNHI